MGGRKMSLGLAGALTAARSMRGDYVERHRWSADNLPDN
jgi:hypothetical protein